MKKTDKVFSLDERTKEENLLKALMKKYGRKYRYVSDQKHHQSPVLQPAVAFSGCSSNRHDATGPLIYICVYCLMRALWIVTPPSHQHHRGDTLYENRPSISPPVCSSYSRRYILGGGWWRANADELLLTTPLPEHTVMY